MMLVPPETPVTIPVDETVATVVDTLDHTPPVVASESVMAEPAHTVNELPEIAAGITGSGFTVTVIVAVPAEATV